MCICCSWESFEANEGTWLYHYLNEWFHHSLEKIVTDGRNVQIFLDGVSFEWLVASVAARVREESPDTHWNFIYPSWISFSHPCSREVVILHKSLFVLHFIFFTRSFSLPLHSLLQGPSIYSWKFEVNIALKECRGHEYIWDCADSSPHPTAFTLWQPFRKAL